MENHTEDEKKVIEQLAERDPLRAKVMHDFLGRLAAIEDLKVGVKNTDADQEVLYGAVANDLLQSMMDQDLRYSEVGSIFRDLTGIIQYVKSLVENSLARNMRSIECKNYDVKNYTEITIKQIDQKLKDGADIVSPPEYAGGQPSA
jgi:hypothetical protein